MSGRIEARLKELGIELPEARAPKVARIKGANIAGNMLYVSGQVPQWNGELPYIGKVGRDFSVEEGTAAARLCALNVLAHAKEALDGDLDRIVKEAIHQHRVLRVHPGRAFEIVRQHPLVVDDLHASTTENIGGSHQHGIADLRCDAPRLLEREGCSVAWSRKVRLREHPTERTSLLRKVYRLRACTNDGHTCVLEPLG